MKVRYRDPMIALNVKAFSPVGDGTNQDGLPGPIVIARIAFGSLLAGVAFEGNEVENGGGEMANGAALLMGDIAGHGQRL